MKWKVYSRLMRPMFQDEEPVQPRREDRRFLRYAEKPPMESLEDADGFHLINKPIKDVAPRPDIEGINFNALQYWLDHLGPAIYNPVCAYLDDSGEYHVDPDGGHRLRCLWEIGEPSIRVMVRRTRERTSEFSKWVRRTLNEFPKPSVDHFKENPSLTWRQYYPCIYPAPEILVKFYGEEKDGAYYRDTLDSPMSFTEILSQNESLSYRMDILDEMLRFDVVDKSVLDLGCYFGHYSLLLLEHGASSATCIDNNKFRVNVANHIAQRRGINRSSKRFKAMCGDINHYVETSDIRPDIVLLLNVFHHLLAKNESRAWNTLNTLLDRCGVLFLMTQNLKGVYDEWGGDVEVAMKDRTGAMLKRLLKSGYRNRVLWAVGKDR